MVTARVRQMLKREIQRMEAHIDALYDILEEVEQEAPKRKVPENVNSRIPLIEKAIAKVRGTRTFSVKEITALCRRMEPDLDRRTIYNCVKGYLQRNLDNGMYEQISATEYRRGANAVEEQPEQKAAPRRTRPVRG